ncbi:MAG: MarR family transcriptional regulator [Chloroflexi bacterium]|nr:MarR family transcriptional regulator [Chloroflexota bacterium]
MTVRIGNVTFPDWVSLPFEDGWSDTFIFRISSLACVPPFYYEEPLHRMASHARSKRSSASIWVQVDGPGEWFAAEVRKSLVGLALPFAVTRGDAELNYLQFSRPPTLLYSRSQPTPSVEDRPQTVSPEELRCLQALGRMDKGNVDEIASLIGLSIDGTKYLLASLEEKKLVVYKIGVRFNSNKTMPPEMDPCPLWHLKPKGLSIALRSWNIPKKVDFSSRLEENRRQIGFEHRRISRRWPAWLQTAWPHAEIWTGWSEVRIPETSVIPDGLAWGRIHGYETLFWLEVGDGHKSKDTISDITTKRLNQARKLCERTGARLVYAQLSTNWVHEAAGCTCAGLPNDVAVILGNWKKFGKSPIVEWGKVTTM